MNLSMKVTVLTGALLLAGSALAADPVQTQSQTQTETQTQTRTQERIYGSQLMTPQERATYRQQMRSLKTWQERQTFRLQHHKEMQERARERGITLPDMVPGQGRGQGQGSNMNRGMGGGNGGGGRK